MDIIIILVLFREMLFLFINWVFRFTLNALEKEQLKNGYSWRIQRWFNAHPKESAVSRDDNKIIHWDVMIHSKGEKLILVVHKRKPS